MSLFESVLIANRGEIAVRIIRTLRRLGIRSIAVYSDADAGALHVRQADHSVRLGPAAASESYLSIERLMAAVLDSGAAAVHPGYGFLSENTAFAAACAAAGVVFVGPPAAAIEAMGDKIRAKQTVAARGVPVVPGRDVAGLDDAQLAAAAREIGFPVLLKPSAGGGGKGMRRVDGESTLLESIASARREARSSFGDDTILVERFVANPRHIEIQVLADTHGNVVHLGERECSLQRRHQKIIEEAPSPLLNPEQRAAMGTAAVEAARACGYTNAGTVEFIVSADRPDEFFFMEMNTRLQVEHPVTEQVYGVDLVELQLRIAAGEILPFTQADLRPSGHSIEARVYAEDPAHGFLPSGGGIVYLREPSGAVRVDSSLAPGLFVGSDYDPMLAKIIATGNDRAEALRRLDRALAETAVLGVTTNVAFLRRLLADPNVVAGRLDTGLVDRFVAAQPPPIVPDEAFVAVAIAEVDGETPSSPWDTRTGWRSGHTAPLPFHFSTHDRERVDVTLTSSADGWLAAVDDGEPSPVCLPRSLVTAPSGDGSTWVGIDGSAWPIHERLLGRGTGAGGAVVSGAVRAPMPGRLIVVTAVVGARVAQGEPLAVVEAMKMEHALVAPCDGVVREVHGAAGAQVALHEIVVVVEPEGEPT